MSSNTKKNLHGYLKPTPRELEFWKDLFEENCDPEMKELTPNNSKKLLLK